MVNKVILLGFLGGDPEVRSTPQGQPVATFSIATSRKWKDKSGERQEQTEWHQVVAWGKQAEIAGQYLTKGKLVFVEGRLQTRSWEDRQSGEKKYRTEIVCDHFQMLPGQGGDGKERPKSGYQAARGRERPDPTESWGEESPAVGGDPYGDDDVPF